MDFKPVSGNSITVNPPMKSISSTVGFVALSKACSFAEEILSKYGKTEDGYFSADTLVFLNRIRDSLQTEKTRCDQMMLALKLMISHRLILMGKVSVPGSGRIVRESYERRISQLMLMLRNTDRLRWSQLTHIREALENDDRLLSVIRTTEREIGTYKEILTYADIGELMRLAQPSASSGEIVGAYPARIDFPAFSELALISAEKAESRAAQLNINGSETFYSDAGDLIYKTEQSITEANDNEIASNSDKASPSVSLAAQDREPKSSVNASDSTESLKGAESVEYITNNTPSEKTAFDKQISDFPSSDRPSAAEDLALNEYHRQYPTGDSLIHRNEKSETFVEQIESADVTNTSVVSQTSSAELSNTRVQNSQNISQTDISVDLSDAEKVDGLSVSQVASNNVLQISTDEAQYQSGDSLIFKNEYLSADISQTDISNDSDIVYSDISDTMQVFRQDTVNSSEEKTENVLQISSDEAQYQSGDSLVFKNEYLTADILQTDISNNSDIVHSENSDTMQVFRQDTVNSSEEKTENVLQISTDEAQYQSGDSLIFKNETNIAQTEFTDTENITKVSQAVSAEFSNARIRNIENPSQTVVPYESIDVRKADEANASQKIADALTTSDESQTVSTEFSNTLTQDVESISQKDFTDKTTDAEKDDEPSYITEPSENVLQINTDEAQYQSGDSLIFKSNHFQADIEQTDVSQLLSAARNIVTTEKSPRDSVESSTSMQKESMQKESVVTAAREHSAVSTEPNQAAQDPFSIARVDSVSEPATKEAPIRLMLNAYLSSGASYFSGLYRKNSGRTVVLSSLLRQIFSGLQRNTKSNNVFRAITLLNHPEKADENEQTVLRYAEETVLTERIYSSGSAEDFRERFMRLSDSQRTDILRAVTLKLREQEGLPDSGSVRIAVTEDRLFRMLGVYGAPLINEIEPESYPDVQEFRYYYRHTNEERTMEEVENLVRVIEKNSNLHTSQKTAYKDISTSLLSEKALTLMKQYPESDQGRQLQNAQPLQADRDGNVHFELPRSVMRYFSLVSKAGFEPSEYGDYGYSGYPLHHVMALDTVVGRRQRALQAARKISRGSTPNYADVEAAAAYSDTAGGIALISERTLRDITEQSLTVRSDSALHTESSTESKVVRHIDDAVDYSGVTDTLSLHEQQPAQQIPPQTPTSAVSPPLPTTDELVSRFGNLIDGADYTGVGMELSLQGNNGDLAKGLSELSARINQAENQARANAEALKELQKKQNDTDKTVLKSTDMRKLYDEVVNRLRQQLRLDRSRYGL